MKTLITLLVLLLVAFVAIGMAKGWIHFNKTQDKATIEIETNEIKESAKQTKEEGKELLKKAGKSLKRNGQQTEESVADPDAAVTPSKKKE